MSSFESGSDEHASYEAVWIHGDVDVERLRSTPALQHGEAVEWLDLTAAPIEGTEAAIERAVQSLDGVTAAHDASAPWRASILRLDARRHLLMLAGRAVDAGRALEALAVRYAGPDATPTSLEHAAQDGSAPHELDESHTALEIHPDHPRRATPDLRAASVERVLTGERAQALRAAATRANLSLFAWLQGGLLAVLHRYTGQAELAIGARHAGTNAAAARIVRSRIDDETTFVAMCRAGDEAWQRNRRPRAPLQVMLVEHSRWSLSTAATRFERVFVPPRLVAHELLASFRDDGTQLVLRLDYQRALFEPETIAQLLAHWERVLTTGADAPEQIVARLALLSEHERRDLLVTKNETVVTLPPLCLHDLFERQAERTPNAVALELDDASLTYRELDQRAEQMAAYLRTLGVGADTLVGLCVERSLEMAIGVLAILKAGGAYVPLDPAYPRERLAWILTDAHAPVLLTQRTLTESLPDHDATVIYLDDPLPAAAHAEASRPALSSHLAYVIYTSGSTGRPKGICLPHAALVNLILWHDRTLLRGARTLQFASLSFDASCHEMFAAWASGGTVVLVPEPIRRDVAQLTRFLFERRIEKAIFPVVVLQQIAEHVGADTQRLQFLREVTTTGEQLHVTASIRRLFEQLPRCPLHNHYGPSETHVVTAHTLPADPSSWPSHPSIGKPIDNTTIYILDRHGSPVPHGVVGELYLGGVGLARCYNGRPDLTAERFVPHPFGAEGERLYRTGDLARYLRDGSIEFLGRIDHQVKIRGHRVELGEIEGTLTRHPSVREAVVVLREDRPGERRLVAYVVVDRNATADSGARPRPLTSMLRGHLRDLLPDYMVPAAFVALESIPLTANGKVDRGALPAPGPARPALDQPYLAARTPVEAALVDIWRETLGLERIGVLDNFFDLGGDSLGAVEIFARIQQRLSAEISFATLFTGPTIAKLAENVAAATVTATAAIPQVPRTEALPLSFAQERLWFLHRFAPTSPAYNCPYFFRLRGALDSDALARSVQALVRRHEILRTSFPDLQGRPSQRIHSDQELLLEQLDLRALTGERREAELSSHLEAEAARPFDLARGPVIRAGLIALDADEHVFWINLHHIVTDGRSMAVLFRELTAGYHARVLPELPLQYVDFASWQRASFDEEALAAHGSWWRERLAGAPPLLALPADRPRPPVQSFHGDSIAFSLEGARTDALRTLGAAYDTTLTMVVLAGFAALLHRYTGQDDLVIGIPSLGRDRVETEELLGFFVNTLPLRLDLSGQPRFVDLLQQVQRQSLAAFEHDAMPFERIVQELHVERSASHSPVVQITIAPQPPGEHDLRLEEIAVEHLDVRSTRAVFDLTLYCWDTPTGMTGRFEYSTDLFDRSTIQRLVDHFLTLLEDVSKGPEREVAALSLLTPTEHRQLAEWSRTPAPAASTCTFHELFAAQAARAPERIAVVDASGQSLSYAQLDAGANRLARHLRARGVDAGDLVAVCMDRSLELVIAFLGILKAGGAYLPLDPAYPAARLAFMVADAAPRVLVTRARLETLVSGIAEIVRVDDDAAVIAAQSDVALPNPGTPEQLAYVIYTSGSTGQPKGTLIEHRSLVNLAEAQGLAFGMSKEARVLQFAALSFDAAIAEFATTLTVGATLCLLPPDQALLGPDLGRFLRDQQVTLAMLVPSVLPQIPLELLDTLDTLVVGGEPCSAELVERYGHGRRFINVYGPTECAVCATCAICEPGDAPPIGRPLANVRVHVLDERQNRVPIGVVGELYIGGAGVGRGYLNRSNLTTERFHVDPFEPSEADGRMYRTGDLVRWRSDGNLEFVGRRDGQVKVRGFRIELGEIDAAIREQPGVGDVAVVTRDDGGNRRLVAYVVPDSGSSEHTGTITQHIGDWHALYEDMFREPRSEGDGSADFTGWNSSYTGQPLPLEQMNAWRDHTVERILALAPTRIWEIGCGTGLLLLPIAPRCAAYFGTDISESELSRLADVVTARELRHVTLEQRRADDFDAIGTKVEAVDTIVLNSVVQYFPNLSYLHRVLLGALATVKRGGAVFVGDVRSLPLLEAFRATVELARAPADLGAERLRERVERAVAGERELAVDPAFFLQLAEQHPEIGQVEILIKRGHDDNELTAYRYDVVLYVGQQEQAFSDVVPRTFAEVGATLAAVERWLAESKPETALLASVPNKRVLAGLRLVEWLNDDDCSAEQLASRVQQLADPGVHPEALWQIGQSLGYAVRIRVATAPGELDVLFERSPRAARPRPWPKKLDDGERSAPQLLANDPLAHHVERSLPSELRTALTSRLPGYMVPTEINVLKALPLSPTGKVDRVALSKLATERALPSAAITPPRTTLEHDLCRLWAEILSLPRVGIHDDFFALGGDSLMVVWLMVRVEDLVGFAVPMHSLYEAPTIGRLAALLETRRHTPEPGTLCYSPTLDLETEAVLAAEVQASAAQPTSSAEPGQVFLTGATGFVGAHLLSELLATTAARVHCLIRARDAADAMGRVRRSLTTYGLPVDTIDARVVPVVGDLEGAQLGLDDATFARLAASIDAIYHNGAKVDHVRGYAKMTAANIRGTHEVLRLAAQGQRKPVHFISTLGTVYPAQYLDSGVVLEDATAGPIGQLPNGYMQSKCVAERLVTQAIERGLPATIYRLGAITGNSITGACNPGDFTYSAIRSTIELGFADNLDSDLTLTPVDFTARAIVALSRWHGAPGQVLHITNPRPFFWLELLELLGEYGYPVRVVSYAECMQGLLDLARRGIDTPMIPFLPFVTQRAPGASRYVAEDYNVPVRWDCKRSLAGLAEMGVELPPEPRRLAISYLDYLVQHRYVHPPEER